MQKTILVTGSAGFIGFWTSKKLMELGNRIIGIDNLNDYYNPLLKEKRNEILIKNPNYKFIKLDISDFAALKDGVKSEKIDIIVHLAAQAGVRYSLKNPQLYEMSNGIGTLNIFELAKENKIEKLIYASSSSVYGGNKKIPFSENDSVNNPVSLYAVTKRSNELLAMAYYNLYKIKSAGLRFFTVYGEFGRPDMALWTFVKNIMTDKEIEVYNHGNMERDFTYFSDIVNGITSVLNKDFECEIYNLGGDNPIKLSHFIELIEKYTNKQAKKKFKDMQKGDVLKTYADLSKSRKELNYYPQVKIEEGVRRFVEWFIENKEWTLKV